jgi:hypothetical protein
MAEDVVWACRLLHPGEIVARQLSDPFDRVVDIPALVRVDGNGDVWPDRGPRDREPPDVVVDVGADLELDLSESVGDRFSAQPLEFGVVVAEPARCSRVRRITVFEQVRLSALPAIESSPQDRECLIASQGVGQVTEVDEVDEFFRCHLG